jgi:hypothetical protein
MQSLLESDSIGVGMDTGKQNNSWNRSNMFGAPLFW